MVTNHYLREVCLLRDKVPSFSDYPFSLAVVRKLDTMCLHPAVTFIIGENGSGKSTLLEAIAVAWGLNPEGGSKNFNFTSRPSHSELHRFLRLVKGSRRPKDAFFFRAESFFNVATEIEKLDRDEEPLENPPPPIINSFGGRSLHEQSHGESFFSLLMDRFGGRGLYILDEPEAALSPSRQMATISRIHELVRKGSQFIIATHSPILMAYPDANIYQLTEDGISTVKYTDTDYYSVTRSFLNDHKKMLDILMEE